MASFHYEAMKNQDMSRITGEIQAADETEARLLLREQDLLPLKLQLITGSQASVGRRSGVERQLFRAFASKLGEQIAFSRTMGTMLGAGVPIVTALSNQQRNARTPAFKAVVTELRADVQAGTSFSTALAKHPDYFDKLYVNLARAGEQSGKLDGALSRLADIYSRRNDIRQRLISAAIYPCFTLLVLGLLLVIMFWGVLPMATGTLAGGGFNISLPLSFMGFVGPIVPLAFVMAVPVLGLTWYGLTRKGPGRLIQDQLFLYLPVVGGLVEAIQCSHFLSALQGTFAAGMPITDGAQLAAEAVDNSILSDDYLQIAEAIGSGETLTAALCGAPGIPEVVIEMASAGEEAGKLESMLAAAGKVLDDEIGHKIEFLMKLTQPLTTLMLAGLFGLVMLLFFGGISALLTGVIDEAMRGVVPTTPPPPPG